MLQKYLSALATIAFTAVASLAIPTASEAQTITYYGNGSGSTATSYGPGYRATTYYYANPLYYNSSPNIPMRTYSNSVYPYANSREATTYRYVEYPYVNYVRTNNPANPYVYTVSSSLNYVPSNNPAYPYSYANYPYVNYVPLQQRFR